MSQVKKMGAGRGLKIKSHSQQRQIGLGLKGRYKC